MAVKRYYLVLLVGLILAGAYMLQKVMQGSFSRVQMTRGRKTVQEVVEVYGPVADERLRGRFEAAGVSYPPGEVVLVGLKREMVLEVWASGTEGPLKLIRVYPILAASGRPGPKLREGDLQVPEGLYGIESLNPNSRFHLSLRLNYPNYFDRAQARRDGRTDLGGDIMIHGSNVSVGCLAVGDEAAEDLFVLAAGIGIEKVSVILSPVDFRKTAPGEASHALPSWVDVLYGRIREELSKVSMGEE
jgi:hypothetical protein